MTEEQRKQICDFLADHSIENILEVYFEDNCYGEVVQSVMDHVENRLAKLSKIEEIMRKE